MFIVKTWLTKMRAGGKKLSTYDCVLELLEHGRIALQLILIHVLDVGYVDRNVSVRLSQRVVDLVRKLHDVVFDFALRVEGRQVDSLDDRLQVTEPILRLRVSGLRLCHLKISSVN